MKRPGKCRAFSFLQHPLSHDCKTARPIVLGTSRGRTMIIPNKTVYVIGAGFTRAFVTDAPLMDKFLYGRTDILDRPHFEPLKDFIAACRMKPDSLNIETLFTLAAMDRPWSDPIESGKATIAA